MYQQIAEVPASRGAWAVEPVIKAEAKGCEGAPLTGRANMEGVVLCERRGDGKRPIHHWALEDNLRVISSPLCCS